MRYLWQVILCRLGALDGPTIFNNQLAFTAQALTRRWTHRTLTTAGFLQKAQRFLSRPEQLTQFQAQTRPKAAQLIPMREGQA